MGFIRRSHEEWQKLSPNARERLLKGLAKTTVGYCKSWWGGKSFSELAKVEDFDDLPGDLCGRLMLAVTDSGFSIKENRRVDRQMRG